MGSAAEEFDQTLKGLTDQRGRVYGPPVTNFERIQALKAAVRDCPDPAIREALEMCCIKMARLVETPSHIDSINDIGGYARCMAMVLDERAANTSVCEGKD